MRQNVHFSSFVRVDFDAQSSDIGVRLKKFWLGLTHTHTHTHARL